METPFSNIVYLPPTNDTALIAGFIVFVCGYYIGKAIKGAQSFSYWRRRLIDRGVVIYNRRLKHTMWANNNEEFK